MADEREPHLQQQQEDPPTPVATPITASNNKNNTTNGNNDNDNDDENNRQHLLTQAQLEAIEDEIKRTQPLTSPLLPMEVLIRQYYYDPNTTNTATRQHSQQPPQHRRQEDGFYQSSLFLSKKYHSLRKIRGDGNCYYRAFLYSLCEQLLLLLLQQRRDKKNDNGDGYGDGEFARLKETISKSLKWTCQYGYEEDTISMFHEELVELFDFMEGEILVNQNKNDTTNNNNNDEDDETMMKKKALGELHSRLNEENASSDYCTWYLRVLTAAQMKSNPSHYLPYVLAENYGDIPSFTAREVEPMGRECGMVQVAALADCLGVRVVIEYMDGRIVGSGGSSGSGGERGGESGENDENDGAGGAMVVHHHVFGEGEGNNGGNDDNKDDQEGEGRVTITLLYRPGHYDILY